MDETTFIARFSGVTDPRPHPGRYASPVFDASWADFGRALTAVGGALLPRTDRTDLPLTVRAAMAETPGRSVASAAAALLVGPVPTATDAAHAPHGLADVALAVVTAELAVAENGAVLLGATTLPERALAWLATEVLVLVHEAALVPDLITAQARLPVPPPHYLTWVAGPSKTADIEQALVIGAHGPRRLRVLPFA
jgi:L-lactate dehydrogenase complex protein LldG